MSGDFSIGSEKWPGISKLVEEAGEVVQVCGKLVATNGDSKHWDGTDLKSRLQEELADLTAAIVFVVQKNGLDTDYLAERVESKLKLFEKWHAEKHL